MTNLNIVFTIVVSLIVFAIGYQTGLSVQFNRDTLAELDWLKSQQHVIEGVQDSLKNSIDGAELIAWIENYMHNYEWISPPTSGEIVKHIREMMKKNEQSGEQCKTN